MGEKENTSRTERATHEAAQLVHAWEAQDFRDFAFYMSGYSPETVIAFARRRIEHRASSEVES